MKIEVITKEDLQELRMQIVDDVRKLIGSQQSKTVKPWLKNSEVIKMLGMSCNKIQRLRISGKLRSSKIGGVHYYRFTDIESLMNNEAA
ncbi:MAG TPA: helix-turn-helix domain-containing protein [Hanamia sp.]|nr:helix-turn-helix domain-containing protein [Hanamia sp.]